MTPVPVALALLICDRVIVDRESQCPTAVNIFNGLAVDGFPTGPQRLTVFAALSDSEGDGTIELAVDRIETGERILTQRHPILIPGRHITLNVILRLRKLPFPAAGWYDFLLSVDKELIAQRRLKVFERAFS